MTAESDDVTVEFADATVVAAVPARRASRAIRSAVDRDRAEPCSHLPVQPRGVVERSAV
ncbi:hypothetical protein DFR70_1011067 [Nocardia tenerifensis]|uniref:Uncharacterized protein n=1 Tax=Nocardia tenerifensis TaxID=228006 RepID=A0A318KHI8_9NOCA|nr:hypothetical protein [Nocardia tenerifensis]PXX71633.1 hypothetical protein DFR70_1011067 [Nocardia tenerifensis]